MSDADRTSEPTRFDRLVEAIRLDGEHVTDDNPRGAPVLTGSAPIVIEKHRIALDGEETVSFYACGVTRASREEARADAVRLAELTTGANFVAALGPGGEPPALGERAK